MKLHMVNAEEGGCLLLEWRDASDSPHVVLIDGGPSGTYESSLRPALDTLSVKRLDLVVNRHVDTRHTTGLLEFFSLQLFIDSAERVPIDELWHNQFGATLDEDGTLRRRFAELSASTAVSSAFASLCAQQLDGIAEGHRLLLRANSLGIELNKSNGRRPFVVDERFDYTLANGEGPTVTVVGPTRASLDALRVAWKTWIDNGAKGLDGNSERSTPNLSSVQFLVREGEATILFAGDGRSDHLYQALAAHGMLDADGAIEVDILELSQHGANRGATRSFFEKVRATTYAISANRTNDDDDPDLLEWIVDAAHEQGRKIKIVLTNQSSAVKQLRASRPTDDYGYTLLVRDDDSPFCTVDPSGRVSRAT